MSSFSLSVLSLLSLVIALLSSFVTGFIPSTVSLSSLAAGSSETVDVVSKALSEIGLLAVKIDQLSFTTESGNADFKNLREQALISAANCALHGKFTPSDEKSVSGIKIVLEDSTNRYTLASQSSGSDVFLSEMQGFTAQSEACREFEDVQAAFRSVVVDATNKFVDIVDQIQGAGTGRKLMTDKVNDKSFESVGEIMRNGMQLEHFHTYEKFPRRFNMDSPDNYVVDVHTDHGLFIALTPAMQLSGLMKSNSDGPEHGFYIQLPNGDIVQPDFGEEDVVVFMIGDGFSQWLNEKLPISFRATPHAVRMAASASNSVVSLRTWYGRMVLPGENMFLENQGMTFGELKLQMSNRKTLAKAASTACSDGLVLNTRQLQATCATGQISCWAGCRAVTDTCSTGETAQCAQDDGDGTFSLCDPTQHIGTCAPVCLADSTVINSSSSNDFCNGFLVSMYMDGFTGVGKSSQQCLVFLFNGFALDTPEKYALACLLSILIGMFTESIVKLRRKAESEIAPGKKKTAIKLTLYALQVTMGYIAMLIAMTYAAVLFVMIVLGLTIGHRVFNYEAPIPKEHADACCVQPLESDGEKEKLTPL